MNNDDRNSTIGDQSQKELSISLAASSIINASDTISGEAYQANLKRIQDVKEMVRRLEMNNDAAHKNYLMDQLEKRAMDGREAEEMLVQLKNQPRISQTVQFTNNVPSNKSEVVLPTTATIVEVPESYPSLPHSLPAPKTLLQPPVQQNHMATYPRSLPPLTFRHYVPPHTDRQHNLHSVAPHSQTRINAGQLGWDTTQSVPPQSSTRGSLAYHTGFQPTQVQDPSRSWGSYSSRAVAPPLMGTVPTSEHYHLPAGQARIIPTYGVQSAGSSSPAYREPGFAGQATTSRTPITTHIQTQSLPSAAPAAQAQIPLQAISAVPMTSSGPPPSVLFPPKQVDAQSQPVFSAVSKSALTSEFQLPRQIPQSSLQHQQHPQHPQGPQIQPQQFPQFMHQPQHPFQQSQSQPPPQPPIQPPQNYRFIPSQTVPSTGASQPFQSNDVQEPGQQHNSQRPMDQAMFIKLFQVVAQREIWQFKAFWVQAKAVGISDEWFRVAINSLPHGLWQSVMTRANQLRSESAPQEQEPPIPSADIMQPVSTAVSPILTVPVAQAETKPTASREKATYPSLEQKFAPYASQVQYYAEQAVNSAQMATTSTQGVAATPKWQVPQAQANVKTPKDANKSTLARDILRSLGKTVPKPHQGTGGEPTDRASNDGGDAPREVVPLWSNSGAAFPEYLSASPAAGVIGAHPPPIPLAKFVVQDEPQHVTSPKPSTTKPVSEEEHGQAAIIEGPIMIDLTLEDDSMDGKGSEPTSPITSVNATAALQSASSVNTTNHTPLLGSPPLEKSPVDVTADSHNMDGRMYSLPLSFAAEGHGESKLLHPPPASVELVSPSYEPPLHEANEHLLDGKLPLFLPSPPIFPAHGEPIETDVEMTIDENECRSFSRRCSADADQIEIDTKLSPPRIEKRRNRQVYVLIPPAPLYVKMAKLRARSVKKGVDSDLDEVGDDEEFQYSHLERLLIEESKSQLFERRCRWLNCDAILNCATNLLAHLKNHVREEDLQAPFNCLWAGCQRQFGMEQDRDVHLEIHAIRPLPCPFAGCDEQFDRPVEVMQHEVQHQKMDREEPLIRKSTCHPIVPAIPARLGPPPHRLPSHRVIPRRIVKCRISADRHAIVGPWVLWNIFSPVDLDTRKQNASMRGRPTRQATGYDMGGSDSRRDDYDFLSGLSSHPEKNAQLDDLDSTLVTMSAARGLTLWGSGSTVNGAMGATSSDKCTNAASATTATEETEKQGQSKGADARPGDSTPKEGRSSQAMGMGEEDAVERMLIL